MPVAPTPTSAEASVARAGVIPRMAPNQAPRPVRRAAGRSRVRPHSGRLCREPACVAARPALVTGSLLRTAPTPEGLQRDARVRRVQQSAARALAAPAPGDGDSPTARSRSPENRRTALRARTRGPARPCKSIACFQAARFRDKPREALCVDGILSDRQPVAKSVSDNDGS